MAKVKEYMLIISRKSKGEEKMSKVSSGEGIGGV